MLYRFDRVNKSYGPKVVLREATWQHNPGEKVGLIGRNGAGKTTLLRIALGREEPDSGEFIKANAVRIATVDQALPSDLGEKLHDFVAGAFAHLHAIESELRQLEHAMAEGDDSPAVHDRYDALTHRFENEGGYDMVAEVERALSGLGFAKADFERPLAELSGGQKNRAMLARAILSSPDVLLLDEPTNHLDFQAVEFLEEYLAKSRRAYLVVTHDRRFLDRVAEEIVDLENGRLTGYSGGYTSYKTQKAERILSETRAFEKQQDFIDKEQEYIRRNIAGVNSRQAKGRRTKLARVDRLERPVGDVTNVDFQFDTAKVGGRIFLRAKDVDAGYAAGAPIVRGVNFELLRGERLAILGENGTGKTTLLKTLAGRLPAARGNGDAGPRRLDRLLRPGAARPRSQAAGDRRGLGPAPGRDRGGRPLVPRPVRVPRGRRVRRHRGPLRRGKGPPHARRRDEAAPQPAASRRADQPPRPRFARGPRGVARRLPGLDRFRVARPRLHRPARDARRRPARWARRCCCPGNYTETADARTERRKRPEPAPARRGDAPAPAAAPAKAAASLPPEKAAPRPARSAAGSDDKEATRRRRRIKTLEEKIAALETEIESLETRLWEEALTLGPVAAHELSKQKLARKEELDALVEEWAKLSEEADQPAPRTP